MEDKGCECMIKCLSSHPCNFLDVSCVCRCLHSMLRKLKLLTVSEEVVRIS